MTDLEKIIEKQIANYYGNSILAHGAIETTYQKSDDDIQYGKCDIILIFGDEKSPEGLNTEELMRWAFSSKVSFSYITNEILLTVDEYWENNKLKDFLEKTINQQDIIDAINNKTIKLTLKGLHDISNKQFYNKLIDLLTLIGINNYYIQNIE